MSLPCPRLAVRAVLIHDGRLLMVNAYPGQTDGLMCAPGGGVERGASLPSNLRREVYEESGLRINVGAPCLCIFVVPWLEIRHWIQPGWTATELWSRGSG